MLRRLWFQRHLVFTLARRQYQLRYRQSFVGVAWAFLLPLATLAAATLVFDKVARVETGEVSYPLFALSALAPWTIFATSITNGVPSILAAAPLITRLAFPRAALPLGAVIVAFLDLLISGLLFVGYALISGEGLPATALWSPLLLAVELVLIVGIVLFASALNMFARDARVIVPVLVNLWLLVTPVMYPLDEVPGNLRSWYLLNPMTGLIESFRRVLVYGEPPRFGLLLPAVVGAAAALLVGVWYFGSTESRFADVV